MNISLKFNSNQSSGVIISSFSGKSLSIVDITTQDIQSSSVRLLTGLLLGEIVKSTSIEFK